ncbi:hypothetical protein CSA80_04795 [Candidatus Saccharibacteria bacterium]|nr:MAG: hypothetical protein CSA80_04795 [Candidatus Saccharibacteria bacterium]
MKKTTKQKQAEHWFAIDYIGWYGVLLLLGNYTLLSAGVIAGQSFAYHGMALLGSFCIAFEAWHKRDRQPAVLNFIFVGLAVFAIIRLIIVNPLAFY